MYIVSLPKKPIKYTIQQLQNINADKLGPARSPHYEIITLRNYVTLHKKQMPHHVIWNDTLNITRQGWFQGKGTSGATLHTHLLCVAISKARLVWCGSSVIRAARLSQSLLIASLIATRNLVLSHKPTTAQCEVSLSHQYFGVFHSQRFPVFASRVGMLDNCTLSFYSVANVQVTTRPRECVLLGWLIVCFMCYERGRPVPFTSIWITEHLATAPPPRLWKWNGMHPWRVCQNVGQSY